MKVECMINVLKISYCLNSESISYLVATFRKYESIGHVSVSFHRRVNKRRARLISHSHSIAFISINTALVKEFSDFNTSEMISALCRKSASYRKLIFYLVHLLISFGTLYMFPSLLKYT